VRRQRRPRLRGHSAGDDELVGGGDQGPLPVGESLGIRALEDLGLQVLADAAGARQPAVLLQLVGGVAKVTHPQDDEFGILA
jgi:hypothetical protein